MPKIIRKLNWDSFFDRAYARHKDRFDYSEVTTGHIERGTRSKIPIRCRWCNYSYQVVINSHINKGIGCPNCSNRLRFTLEKFLDKAYQVHGTKFDYSEIAKEQVQSSYSKIPIRCRTCNTVWDQSVHNHLQGYGCPCCAGNLPWTLDRFLDQARQIHGDKYDYSLIADGDVVNRLSRVSLRCRRCDLQWTITVDGHINQRSGCRQCSGNVYWTLDRFLDRSYQIYDLQ